ncbi:hypothetical protein N658DRAFT_509193 [Parathielavia hyrcaniae]|uniref:Uncharacterized protein n=1 Tax=Parathielavia hyrcaniae TaxID=113614 RepID=A0AAN6PW84_9PEZI|nr:hypothetical protein N658DRAFT_509193 [Parathielavia hyrcaniae]
MNPTGAQNSTIRLHNPPSPPGSAQFQSNNTAKNGAHQNTPRAPRGLCTPPADDNMGTTYEALHLPSRQDYDPYASSAYAPIMPQPGRYWSAQNERPAPHEYIFDPISRYAPLPPPNHAQVLVPAPTVGIPASAPTAATLPAINGSTASAEFSQRLDGSRQPKQPTPPSTKSMADSAASSKMTDHSMRIPERISPTGGSISEFMAEVAALFWFDSTKLLDKVEKMGKPGQSTPVQPLAPTAVANPHFEKWVSTVLGTTQVTQNVVLLALLYIYRLKRANPTVKGRPGSEYRLLTVALMLGNKFLDDNTYTNKTWADVSGISVNEIHVMEVEFLSNMRYSLLVSAEGWEQWLDKLAKFWSYLELAQQARSPTPSPLLVPSPIQPKFVTPLRSPTVPKTPSLRPATAPYTLQSPDLAHLINHSQGWHASYGGSNAASPVAPKPESRPYRKRSYLDEDSVEPPAKRVTRMPATALPQPPVQYPLATAPQQAQPDFPIQGAVAPVQPRLAAGVSTTQPQPYEASACAAQQPSVSLPPLASGVRAMAMVYPTTTYAPSQAIPTTCGLVSPTLSFPPMGYATPTKRLSPQNGLSVFPGSSPLGMANPMCSGPGSGLHTPISHSPSLYLQQRNSPYKPVRHVNTLLYPPPSAFLQQYHRPNPVLPNQMHYKPIGKRNEYRTGIVPEFLPRGASRLDQAPLVDTRSPEQYQPPPPPMRREGVPYPGPY